MSFTDAQNSNVHEPDRAGRMPKKTPDRRGCDTESTPAHARCPCWGV